ncbi:transcriptional regulator, AraC family [Desulfatibacillum aliphaticivorans]|uniref:Transcriptional regulator, AraC family n=1 Tax=Desulfatibacillum aliphaticivorans TaxID=218208 RepID=B8FFF0_DESAL|nr:helix-turn-helix domain-containing protein [Desulfatibacillum aliphaticivorans]ACL04210.1 transcriptional regulator, AraC family [Desulfatibacillum aliphaticivorans]
MYPEMERKALNSAFRGTGDSPLIYLQRVRIEAAKHQLEKTAQSIEEITQQVGCEDPNSFRKLFKKTTGLSPREYRNRFTRLLKPVLAG